MFLRGLLAGAAALASCGGDVRRLATAPGPITVDYTFFQSVDANTAAYTVSTTNVTFAQAPIAVRMEATTQDGLWCFSRSLEQAHKRDEL